MWKEFWSGGSDSDSPYVMVGFAGVIISIVVAMAAYNMMSLMYQFNKGRE